MSNHSNDDISKQVVHSIPFATKKKKKKGCGHILRYKNSLIVKGFEGFCKITIPPFMLNATEVTVLCMGVNRNVLTGSK